MVIITGSGYIKRCTQEKRRTSWSLTIYLYTDKQAIYVIVCNSIFWYFLSSECPAIIRRHDRLRR